jgi:site-specific DNA-cytosine methylase
MIVDEQNAAAVTEVGALSSGSAHGNRGFSVAATLTGGGHPNSTPPGRHHEDDDNLVVARSQTARNERIDAETENLLVANSLDGGERGFAPRGDGADNLIAFDWQAGGGGNDDSFRGKSRSYTVRSGDYAQIGATKHDAIAGFYTHRGQNLDTAYREDESPPILSSQTAPGIEGSMGVRRLTPLECERLQGFPDNWTELGADNKRIPDSHRYRLMGNAVATVCAEWIGHRLVEANRW